VEKRRTAPAEPSIEKRQLNAGVILESRKNDRKISSAKNS
jgi:hypothetical protein